MTNKYLGLAILLAAALFFVATSYHDIHPKYEGQLVYPLCGGGYVTVSSLGPGPNPGGPCIAGAATRLQSDYTPFYVSLVVAGIVLGAAGSELYRPLTKKTRRK